MTPGSRIAILGGQRIPFARQATAYADASALDMLTACLQALVTRFDLRDQRLGAVAAGAVLKHTRDFNLTREATLSSGLSPQTPAFDVQQACATSLAAALAIGNQIGMGQIEVGIAGGVDSASDAPLALSERLRQRVLALRRARTMWARLKILAGLRPSMLMPSIPNVNERRSGMSMGEHCERMVKRWEIGRAAQDALALASHRNAAAAWDAGFYADLVVPFAGLERDNNLRPGSTPEQLARLPPVFDRSPSGTLTAANSTPLTDGAAAVLLASEQWAQRHGHTPWAWLVDAEMAAVDYFGAEPEGLLMAPVYAVPRLLARHGLQLQDFDCYEIHEAFAGQVLCTLAAWEDPVYCKLQLGLPTPLGAIDRRRLNVHGGSVGIGHPFAATGARILAGAAKQLAQLRAQTGRQGRCLVSVCAAGGLGTVAILQG